MQPIRIGRPTTQDCVDDFYHSNGPCCAGCDWWKWHNAVVGDCTRSAPVSGHERLGMLNMQNCSMTPEAGHVLTKREHVCGEFVDSYDWSKDDRYGKRKR